LDKRNIAGVSECQQIRSRLKFGFPQWPVLGTIADLGGFNLARHGRFDPRSEV